MTIALSVWSCVAALGAFQSCDGGRGISTARASSTPGTGSPALSVSMERLAGLAEVVLQASVGSAVPQLAVGSFFLHLSTAEMMLTFLFPLSFLPAPCRAQTSQQSSHPVKQGAWGAALVS